MQNTPAIPPSPIPPIPSQLQSSGTLNTNSLRKAIGRYHKELDEYKGKANYELALRVAFHNLLADGARQVGWTLVDEQTIEGGIRPDGVMRDANNLRRGYWEAKGPESDLDKEIAEKIKKNYPLTNTIFENTRRAVLFQALTSRSFNRQEFLKHLDRYYVAIEGTARGIESWSERQEFLNTVYEGFFQGFSVKQADTHGIVYTPQEIVDFMCNSVEEVLKREFGTSIAEPGVQILDPCVGTGSFIVNLVRHHIPASKLKYKYEHDLFCNEIMLLPYYIASLNIEHEYFERMHDYLPFEGICFADTLELAQDQQLSMFVEQNTDRIQREKDAQIMVVIGNPPYNAWQKSENDNNKNRKYKQIDKRVSETYAADSKASNKNALSDAYVKFFAGLPIDCKGEMALPVSFQTTPLLIKSLLMVCAKIYCKTLPAYITSIYMATCAKIRSFPALHIMSLVFRLELAST